MSIAKILKQIELLPEGLDRDLARYNLYYCISFGVI